MHKLYNYVERIYKVATVYQKQECYQGGMLQRGGHLAGGGGHPHLVSSRLRQRGAQRVEAVSATSRLLSDPLHES